MASKKKHNAAGGNKFRAFLKGPAGLPTLVGVGAVLIILLAALIFWAVRAHASAPAATSDVSSWSEPADDLTYTATEKVDKEQFSGTILPVTEDAGQEYIDETLFLGDSNTARYMYYGPSDKSDQHFTTIENNVGVVSMGVTAITSLKWEQFVGQAEMAMPEIVKVMQPKRIIIGFGTNNLTMETEAFITSYKKGLAAIHKAYPYADIIVNAIPPLDKERENGSLSMKQVDRLNAAIVKMCEQEGYKYLDSSETLEDSSTGWAKKDYTLGDGVHLNQNGVRAFFEYVRTHAYVTEDTRPKPLKTIPKIKGVTPGLITSDPIAVRGAKVPVDFVAGEGGSIQGATSQSVKKGQQCSAVTAVPDDGWEFAGWSATIGHVDGSATITFTVPGDADANGVVVTALFKQAEHEHDWEKIEEKLPTCVDKGYKKYRCTVCKEEMTKELEPTGEHQYENGVCKVCGQKDPNASSSSGSSSVPDSGSSSTPVAVCSICGETGHTQENCPHAGQVKCGNCGQWVGSEDEHKCSECGQFTCNGGSHAAGCTKDPNYVPADTPTDTTTEGTPPTT